MVLSSLGNNKVPADSRGKTDKELPKENEDLPKPVRDSRERSVSDYKVEGVVRGRAEALSIDRNHNKRVIIQEANEPLKARNAAPAALDKAQRALGSGVLLRLRSLLRLRVGSLQENPHDENERKDKRTERYRPDVVREPALHALRYWERVPVLHRAVVREVPDCARTRDDEVRHRYHELAIPEKAEKVVRQATLHAGVPRYAAVGGTVHLVDGPG